MKKLLISLVLLIPLVSGCASIDTKITINDDKSATVGTSLAYKGNLADGDNIAALNISNNYKNFIDKYYKTDVVTSEKLSTINAIKKVNNIEKEDLNLTSLGFESNLPSKKFIEVKKNFMIKSYNIDLIYNFPKVAKSLKLPEASDEILKKSGLEPEYYHRYIAQDDVNEANFDTTEYDMASNLDDSAKMLVKEDIEDANRADKKEKSDKILNLTFSVEVPSFASYNNADSSNGNVYTWNINQNEPTQIKLQYVCYSGWAFTFIILAGILFLAYVAKRIRRRDSQKRIDNIENII